MKVLLQGLGCIALLAVAWLAGEAAYSVRYARQRSVYTFDQLNKVLRETSQTLDEVRKGATVWEKSSQEQAKQTTQAMLSVNAAASRLTSFISNTDNSVNSSLLPTISAAVQSQSANFTESQKQLQTALLDMSKVSANATKVLADADAQINSPDIKIAMDNFAASSANLATATKEGAASMTDIHAALDYEIKQLEAPVTKLKAAGMIALTVIRKLYF